MKNEDDDANAIDQIASNDCFTEIDPGKFSVIIFVWSTLCCSNKFTINSALNKILLLVIFVICVHKFA